MSITNYAKKLINEGSLICESSLPHPHAVQKLWAPDFMESIVFIAADKQHYQSVLNFFWQSIFHQREVSNEIDALELVSATHLYKVTLEQGHEKIKEICPQWYQKHKQLIPEAKWTHIIWDDANDVFITFEDEQQYYAWGWDTVA